MQGDWWMEDSTNGRFVKESRNFHSQDRWFSRPTSPPTTTTTGPAMPTVVTLTVQPLRPNPVAENLKVVRDSSRPRPMPMGFGLGTQSSAYTKRRKKQSKNNEAEKRPISSQDPKSRLKSPSQPLQNDLDWTYFLDKHLPFSSSNSPYGHQEIPTTASPLTNSSQLDAARSISDDLHNLERKLERERDRRTNTESLGVAKFETKVSRRRCRPPVAPQESPAETATSRLSFAGGNDDCTVLGDENMESYKRNGFRPSARGNFFTREHHPSTNSNTLTNLNNDNLLAMGALAITAPPSASSRKQQLLSKDLRAQPSHMRSRGTMTLPLGRERAKQAKFVYADAVSGATPAFQQRISELASLENETLRYERTRKLKKKLKQERD